MSEWREIESAPKDGTKIDLWHPMKGRLVEAFWTNYTYTLYEPYGWTNQRWGRITGVSHWMPIPAGPHDAAPPSRVQAVGE